MGRRRDAALTLVVLVPLLTAAAAVDAPVTTAAVAAGCAGALALEALLSLRAARVRAAWDRPRVQLASVVGGVALAAAAAVTVGPVALTVLVAGLATYLVLLAAVSARGT